MEYAIGYDPLIGYQQFDPTLPIVFNSLQTMKNGSGYYVKTNAVVGGDQYRLAKPHTYISPIHMIITGHTNLKNHTGKEILIQNKGGEVLGKLKIIQHGWLKPTPIYGDDPSTDFLEGVNVGEELVFVFGEQQLTPGIYFTGQMGLKEVSLNFAIEKEITMEVAPHPVLNNANISYNLPHDGKVEFRLVDLMGKTVGLIKQGWQIADHYNINWQVGGLSTGIYILNLYLDNEKQISQKLLIRN